MSTLSSYKRPKNEDIQIFQVTHGVTTTRHSLYQYMGIVCAFKLISGSF